MEEKPEGLYQIGEIATSCGVTRRAILHYEDKGLISPSYISDSSGYRYYTSRDLSNLMLVMKLKDAELSLDEIADYFGGAEVVEQYIAHLEARKEHIDKCIAELRSRNTRKGDYLVEWITLPERICFVRSFSCRGVEEATAAAIQTVDEAIRMGMRFSREYDCFCEFPGNGYLSGELDIHEFSMNACVPLEPQAAPSGCKVYPAGRAIAVHHRGAYRDIGAAYAVLCRYADENNLLPAAPMQEVYMEGPSEYKDEQERYITKVILPIAH